MGPGDTPGSASDRSGGLCASPTSNEYRCSIHTLSLSLSIYLYINIYVNIHFNFIFNFLSYLNSMGQLDVNLLTQNDIETI
jgi:hypothetical protein